MAAPPPTGPLSPPPPDEEASGNPVDALAELLALVARPVEEVDVMPPAEDSPPVEPPLVAAEVDSAPEVDACAEPVPVPVPVPEPEPEPVPVPEPCGPWDPAPLPAEGEEEVWPELGPPLEPSLHAQRRTTMKPPRRPVRAADRRASPLARQMFIIVGCSMSRFSVAGRSDRSRVVLLFVGAPVPIAQCLCVRSSVKERKSASARQRVSMPGPVVGPDR
jgi:hypothetical protein